MTSFENMSQEKVKSGDILLLIGDQRHHYAKSMPMKDIAANIAQPFPEHHAMSLYDFGGVAHHFLGGRGDIPYVQHPPAIRPHPACLFSFLPSNNKLTEIDPMHTCGQLAGFQGTIITTKKTGKRGKAELARHLASHWSVLVYFDDTAAILDDLGDTPSIQRVWIQPEEDSEHHSMTPVDTGVEIRSIPAFLSSLGVN